jgi:hypothetical protein
MIVQMGSVRASPEYLKNYPQRSSESLARPLVRRLKALLTSAGVTGVKGVGGKSNMGGDI